MRVSILPSCTVYETHSASVFRCVVLLWSLFAVFQDFLASQEVPVVW